MKKLVLFSLLLLFTFIEFSYPHKVHAVEGAPLGYNRVCLKEETTNTPGQNPAWRRRLTGTVPVGVTAYVVSMTQSTAGQIITTGNAEDDATLAPFGTVFQSGVMTFIEGQSKNTPADGNINVLISAVPSYTPAQHVNVQYFAVYAKEPQGGGGGPAGEAGALQQASPEMMLFGNGAEVKCTVVIWDPEGRVFDANTLEPMDNVEVTVEDDKHVIVGGIKNPITSDIFGNFRFYVEEGNYYLKVKVPPEYAMVTSLSQIHPNYTKVYSTIYMAGDLIPEIKDTAKEKAQGYPDIERRDIALYSATKRTERPFSLLSHTEMAVDKTVEYSGRLTHPLSKIIIKQGEAVIAEKISEKDGSYSFPVETPLSDSQTPQLPIDISYEKVDLAKANLTMLEQILQKIVGMVNAQQPKTVTIRTQPILQKVEGYAYNQSKAIMPYATVNLRLKNNNAVAIKVYADKNGYFIVPSGSAPVFPYYIEFVDPVTSKTTTSETSDFTVVNSNNIIKLGLPTTSANSTGTSGTTNDISNNETAASGGRSRGYSGGTSSKQPIPTESMKGTGGSAVNNQIVIVLISIILILGVGGAGVYLFMKNKNQTQSF